MVITPIGSEDHDVVAGAGEGVVEVGQVLEGKDAQICRRIERLRVTGVAPASEFLRDLGA